MVLLGCFSLPKIIFVSSSAIYFCVLSKLGRVQWWPCIMRIGNSREAALVQACSRLGHQHPPRLRDRRSRSILAIPRHEICATLLTANTRAINATESGLRQSEHASQAAFSRPDDPCMRREKVEVNIRGFRLNSFLLQPELKKCILHSQRGTVTREDEYQQRKTRGTDIPCCTRQSLPVCQNLHYNHTHPRA